MNQTALWTAALFSVLSCANASSQTTDVPLTRTTSAETRTATETASTWNLDDLYPTASDWERARNEALASISLLPAMQGTLKQGPDSLLKVMTSVYDVRRKVLRLDTYARLRLDANLRDSESRRLMQLADEARRRFDKASSFLPSDLRDLGRDAADKYIAAEPKLRPYAFSIQTVLRTAGHTLSARDEELVSSTDDVNDQVDEAYSLLTRTEMPWGAIELGGSKVIVNSQAFNKYRYDADPKVRKAINEAYWPVYSHFEATLGKLYAAHIQATTFKARSRGYASGLAARLDEDNIPEGVYQTAIEQANLGLPALQRYLRARARLMHLEKISYSDIYAPVGEINPRYSLEQAENLVRKAVAPLGSDYVNTLSKGLADQWMDVYPRAEKRPGGYTNTAAFDVHPYILLNFNDDYNGVTSLAHEWGHAMHVVLTDRAQSFPNAHVSIFLSEIPSTTNEFLLADYVIAHANNKDEKISALTHELDLIANTFFRQALLAEFELEAHTSAEAGTPLTGHELSTRYLSLLKRYYGEKDDVLKVDEMYGIQWTQVPQFFDDFYVYNYATCLSAASYFADGLESQGNSFRQRYLAMLSAGASIEPYEAIKRAGLDMASPQPYQALIARMERLTTKLEALASQS